MKKQKFTVTGMTCAACQANVQRAVSRLDGAKSVDVNLLSGSMTVEYDENILNNEEIINFMRIIAVGYQRICRERCCHFDKSFANASNGCIAQR